MFDRTFLTQKLGYWDSVRFGADSELIQRAQKLLGENFVTHETVSMMCLDVETSLTNHPQFGVSKTEGISAVRRDYRDAWNKWHADSDGNDSYMNFPQIPRKYDTPVEMIVPDEDIRRSLGAIKE